MKKLLIGASSPVAYSYVTERELGRPSPVLESPVTYCLLYEEVWFLTRKLCPPELEKQNFVHFVDEELSPKLPFDRVPESERNALPNWNWEEWQKTIDIITGDGRKWRCDNHARGLDFGGVPILPTPGSSANLFIDRFIATTYGFELVENTPNARASAAFDRQLLRISVSERLLAPRIGTPRAPFGFWHPCIAELRSDAFLKAFRRKVGEIEIADVAELEAKVSEISKAYEEQLRKSLRERFSSADMVFSTAAFLFGLIPVVGQIAGGSDWLRMMVTKIHDRKENAWAAFLGSVEGARPST